MIDDVIERVFECAGKYLRFEVDGDKFSLARS
jgi:hypothetical protein